MAEQARFDVFGAQGFGEQGVGHQVDLADGEVVRGAPVGVQAGEFLVGELGGRLLRVGGHRWSFRVGTAGRGARARGARAHPIPAPTVRVPERAVRVTWCPERVTERRWATEKARPPPAPTPVPTVLVRRIPRLPLRTREPSEFRDGTAGRRRGGPAASRPAILWIPPWVSLLRWTEQIPPGVIRKRKESVPCSLSTSWRPRGWATAATWRAVPARPWSWTRRGTSTASSPRPPGAGCGSPPSPRPMCTTTTSPAAWSWPASPGRATWCRPAPRWPTHGWRWPTATRNRSTRGWSCARWPRRATPRTTPRTSSRRRAGPWPPSPAVRC